MLTACYYLLTSVNLDQLIVDTSSRSVMHSSEPLVHHAPTGARFRVSEEQPLVVVVLVTSFVNALK